MYLNTNINHQIRNLNKKRFLLYENNFLNYSEIKNKDFLYKKYYLNRKFMEINDSLNEILETIHFEQGDPFFYDSGMNKYENLNYGYYNHILTQISEIGTKVYSKCNAEGFYYIDLELNKNLDYEFSFNYINGNFITPIIQIRESENMDNFLTLQRLPNNQWEIYSNFCFELNNEELFFKKAFKSHPIKQGDKIKLTKKGNNIKLSCSDVNVIDYDVKFNSNFYVGFGGHRLGNRWTIFKDVFLK